MLLLQVILKSRFFVHNYFPFFIQKYIAIYTDGVKAIEVNTIASAINMAKIFFFIISPPNKSFFLLPILEYFENFVSCFIVIF